MHEHFHRAVHHKDFDPEDVSAGREYVEAYVPYVHYVERLWDVAGSSAAHEHRAHAH